MTESNDQAPSVADIVSHRYPNVAIDSDVQGWAFMEEFSRGIAAFARLQNPTAADERWLGVCLYQLFRDDEALAALNRAVDRGEVGARVNLAHLLKFMERSDEAEKELALVELHRLGDYDRVFYHRVLSLHQENSGNLRDALHAAEEAWKLVQGIPEFRLLAPAILGQLAVLHGRIGRAQRALWFLERGLQVTGGVERLKVRLKRIAVLVNLGRYREARSELESLDIAGAPEAFDVERLWLHGELSWSTGNATSAWQYYADAASMAQRLRFSYEELLCRLALSSIATSRADFTVARHEVMRAQSLISDRSDRLVFRFREVALLYREGAYTPTHTADEFQALIEAFGEMGLLQEQCAVRLHRADALLTMGNDAFIKELDQIQALSVSLQNQAFLAREWPLLPNLQAIARNTHSRIAGMPTPVVEVLSLGQERILFEGRTVNIPLRRGLEVLAYFLQNKTVVLRDLLEDVFPMDKPRSAKSYFHQFRHQLRENIDGLEIEYDGESKMYRLKSEVDIVWDVAELRAGRIPQSTGTFLPKSQNLWARKLDEELQTTTSLVK